jgi:oligopeptide/dipeptide ABC transporter ATP-binding protein
VALLSPAGLVAAGLWVALIIVAVIGPPIWGEEAAKLDFASARQGPSAAHPLGTDPLGRDVLARTLVATRLSLQLTLVAAGIGAVIGISIGASVGVLHGRLRRAITRGIGHSLAFPPILVALFVVTMIGPGGLGAAIAIGIALVPGFARVAQTLAASIASSDYVDAGRVVGISRHRLLRRYIVPNTAEPLILLIAAYTSTALVTLAAFSFLGLGVQPPAYDWGGMLAQGLQAIYVTPLPALVPGAAIVIAGVAANLLGDAIARSLNPTVRAGEGRRTVGPGAPPSDFSQPLRQAKLSPPSPRKEAVVAAENLRVSFPRAEKTLDAVAGVTFEIAPGEIVGLVGESGSGKTMLSLAIAGLVPYPGRTNADRLEFMGVDLMGASQHPTERLLGTKLAVVFQDPMTSLNPSMRIGRQLAEKVEVHQGANRREALALAVQGLRGVDIPAPGRRVRQYPHEFSGGMRQRAMIAMGLITEPALIIADEPTTALDVTVQAQILDLLRQINAEHETAILFVSHDIAVITELCSRVIVMYAGRIVETLPVDDLTAAAAHPYTQALISTVVDLDTDRSQPLATIRGRPPSPDAMPNGCPFEPRCPIRVERCRVQEPPLQSLAPGRSVACWVALGQETS